MSDPTPTRYLAVDPGEKYLGLAVSDPTGRLARPLRVLRHRSQREDAAAIAQVAREVGAGIIVVGVGLAMIFISSTSYPDLQLAALALTASLYHLLNHAAFKGLLYLATGAIDNLTGQVVEFHKLGGLVRLYPITTISFLVGAVAIAGFPPLNGFISEWLTLNSLLAGLRQTAWKTTGAEKPLEALATLTRMESLLVMLAVLGALAAAFALTAICFYKITGLTFFGQPRTADRSHWSPRDASWRMGGVMAIMAAACLGLGIFPAPVTEKLNTILPAISSAQPLSVSFLYASSPATALSYRSLQFVPILALILAFLLLVTLARRWRSRSEQRSIWNGGTRLDASMQPTGAFLTELIRHALPTLPSSLQESPAPQFLPSRTHLSASESNPQISVEIFRSFYNRFLGWLLAYSTKLGDILQNGDIRRYVTYILLANLIILALFLLWSR